MCYTIINSGKNSQLLLLTMFVWTSAWKLYLPLYNYKLYLRWLACIICKGNLLQKINLRFTKSFLKNSRILSDLNGQTLYKVWLYYIFMPERECAMEKFKTNSFNCLNRNVISSFWKQILHQIHSSELRNYKTYKSYFIVQINLLIGKIWRRTLFRKQTGILWNICH